MSLTNYAENAIVNHVLRSATFAKPAGIYIALHTANPGEAGVGSEVSGGSYARVQSGPSDAAFTAPVDGLSSNAAAITFPAPTGNWGTVSHFALMDAATGGNMIAYAALGAGRAFNSGDAAPVFNAGALSFSVA